MPKRLKKYLKRILIVLVVVGLLGLFAFAWIAYWPWEGKADDLATLVPDDVEFFVRLDYEDLKDQGWVQKNILELPFLGALKELPEPVQGTNKTRLVPIQEWWRKKRAELEAEERRINEQIPLGLIDFDLESDLAQGEAVIAGRWCANERPPDAPAWQELLILKRLPFKSRVALAAFMDHEFIRENVSKQNGMRTSVEDGGIVKLTLPGVRPTSDLARSQCGRGYVMEPENIWYLFRYRDTVMLANSKRLIQSAVDLTTKAVDARASFKSRPGYEVARADGTVQAAVDVTQLQEYTIRLIETFEESGRPINDIIQVRSLSKLSGYLSVESQARLYGKGEIELSESKLSGSPDRMFEVNPGPMTIPLASFVPAEDLFLYAVFHMQPRDLFRAMIKGLQKSDYQIWENNLRRVGHFNTLPAFFDELASWCGTEIGFCMSRLSDKYDEHKYEGWYLDDPEPFPGIVFSVRIGPGRTMDEVREYLSGRVALMGLEIDQELEHKNIKYTRMKLTDVDDIADFPYLSPCFAIAHDTILFANNEDHFRQVLETIAGERPSLAQDDRFQASMGGVKDKGHIGLYWDLEKFFRIPKNPNSPQGMPQGFQWDHRTLVVTADRSTITRGAKLRNELRTRKQRETGRTRLTREQLDEIEALVEADIDAMIKRYPQYVREYWDELKGHRRLDSLAAVLTAAEGSRRRRLELEGNLTLREPEEWETR